MRKHLFIILSLSLLLLSCADGKTKAKEKAIENIESSIGQDSHLKITAISEPDSAFGVGYLTENELVGIANVMMKVNNILLDWQQKNKDKENPKMDPYIQSLSKRHMQSSVDVLKMTVDLSEDDFKIDKREWSGWKVKADYEYIDKYGVRCKNERWFFFDRKGEKIEKSFDLTLP